MKLLLLLVGLALASAATTVTQNNDLKRSITIHRNTPEKYPTEFELGKTHRFNYTGDVWTSFPQTGNETVGQRIQCIVEIVPLTTHIWNMRVVEPTLWEVNGTHDKPVWMMNSTKLTEELRTLLKYNVTFQINHGTIETIFANKTEPEWIVNIKKGMLNMMNLHMEKGDVYEVDEEGISGTCKTLYTINEWKNEDLVTIMNMTKVRDLTNCSKTTFNNVNSFKFQTCDECTKNKNSMEATATFKYNITGTKQRFIINGVQSDARYVFFPLGVKGGSIFVHVNQTLHLINVTEDPLFTKSPEQEPRGTLIYKFPQLVKVQEGMLNTINKAVFMLEKLEDHTTKPFTVDAPSYFMHLIRTLSEANYETLENIWRLVSTKPQQRKWLIEALPFVNQEEMALLIKELITSEETLLTTNEKMTILMRMGTIRQPTEKTVEYLKDICEHKFLQWPHNKKVNTTYMYNIVRIRQSCWRSLGVQIHSLKLQDKYVSPTFIQSLTNCESTFDKSTKLTTWDSMVYKTQMKENVISKNVDEYLTEKEAKALLDTTLVTKVREMCLIAIGQAGLPDLITYIQPILQQTYANQTQDVRIAATIALRRMTTIPHKVLSLVLPIFRNPYEDAELRITAYMVTVRTNKSPSIYTLIGQEMNMEKSKQVRSFVYSHLKMMAENVEPCKKEMALAARYALIYTKPFTLGPTFSKVRSVHTFDSETEIGANVMTQTMFSEGELTPSRTTVNVDMEMFGMKIPFLKVAVKTSGMTNLLDKMFGHDGHFYKRKSIFDLLKEGKRKRRSVNNEEELMKINEKVNPYEVTPEEPHLWLKINLFGNRFTDMEINKDYLTTLIKEGKFLTDFTNLDEELAKKQMFNTTSGMLLMDQKFEHPTIMGLPLSYNTTIASILRLKVNATVKGFPSLLMTQETLTASFNITPEVIVNAVFKMGVHTPLIKFGAAFNSTFNTTLPVQTNFTIDFMKKKYEVLFPQIERNLTFFNFTHKMYTFWQRHDAPENHTCVNTTLTNRKPIQKNTCWWAVWALNDTALCVNMSYVPRLGHPESPFHPLTGPSYFSIYSNKTQWSPKTIKFQYHVKSADTWETEKHVHIIMTTTGMKYDHTQYENVTTMKFRMSQPQKWIMIETFDSTHPDWRSDIMAKNMDGEIDVKAVWGMPRTYTQKVNNTDMMFHYEYFMQMNSQSWTWNNTRNITFFWAELPYWLTNVTHVTKTYVLPAWLQTFKKTTLTDFWVEPLQNPIANSTTISLKVKTNTTLDVEIHLPIEKITVFNVTVPFNTSVVNQNFPEAVKTIQSHFTENYLSGNCTYNNTGKFLTYDQLFYKYNLTGSCPHVLTKDCSPDKRFTVLVQNTRLPNKLVTITPIVTVFIDDHKIEMVTQTNDDVYVKYDGIEHLTYRDSAPIETDVGTIERNTTHITLKSDIGLTVVYSKNNVTTYLSPWYVNKTCGLCGDFNGETFLDMKNTLGEEVTNGTKFGASWLVHGDDCTDSTCKLTKEELYALPSTVYLANKPAVCFSKEPVKLCPIGCNNETPENTFTGEFIPTKQYVKVPFFCTASENVEDTKTQMKSRSGLINSQPVDLYRDIELPHDCNCASYCNIKQ